MALTSREGQILVVDDSEDNRTVVGRFLKAAGYVVRDAVDGVDALSILSNWHPDLIVLDWMMPRLSGLEVLSAVRERYSSGQLPIIMCTARDEPESIARALVAGANDYVTKPVNREILLARVKAQLERKLALETLAAVNVDLERALADRTRSLLEARETRTIEIDAFEEILRLADWLRCDPEADNQDLRVACATSISNAARRLATS